MLLSVCANCQKGIVINNKARPPDVSKQTHSWHSLAAQLLFRCTTWTKQDYSNGTQPCWQAEIHAKPQEINTEMLLIFRSGVCGSLAQRKCTRQGSDIAKKWTSEAHEQEQDNTLHKKKWVHTVHQLCTYFRLQETRVSHPWRQQEPDRLMWHPMVWNTPLDSSS